MRNVARSGGPAVRVVWWSLRRLPVGVASVFQSQTI